MITRVLEQIFRSSIRLFLLAFMSMSNIRSSSSIDWLPDSIDIAMVPDAAEFILTMSASRDVLPSTSGHFKLRIVANGMELNTSCISYGASDSEVSEALVALDPVDDLGGVSVIREGNGSSAFGYGYKYHINSISSTQVIVDVVDIGFLGSGTAFDCSKIVTVGYWDYGGNWETKTVPGSHDEVYIPVDSGFIVLERDTHVSALEMRGGALVTHSSTCLPRWTPAPGSASVSSIQKCYRIFAEATPWASAQTACASAVSSTYADYRGGALGATLVAVQDSDEHRWVARLCSGGTTSRDCWVGGQGTKWVHNAQGVEDSQHRSRAWGGSSTPGDEGKRLCPAMRSLSKSASDQEEGGWYDDECEAEKPFVCQAFGVSTPFLLTVASQLRILGGYIIGSGTVESATDAQVSDDVGEVGLLEGVTLVNSGTMKWSAGRAVGWGGTLENQALLTFSGSVSLSASWDSEGFARRSAQACPLLLNQGTGSILIQEDSSVGVQWLLWNEGGEVLVDGMFHAMGGGHSSAGKFVVDTSGMLAFSNCSFKMDQSESVVVDLHADREVTGLDVEDASDGGGYYRLAFAGEDSECIGYHATANDLEVMLEELDAVRKAGGVSVRREGNGSLRASRFGYRHVIAFDGGRDLSVGSDTPVSLTLSCVGSAEGCDCTDVTGSIPGPGGSRTGCGRAISGAGDGSTSARFSEAACVVQAWVEVETLRRGGETIVSGGGAVTFSDGGQYRLPSLVEADMHVSSGAEVICAQWKTKLTGVINATQGGMLWFAGGNWDALDAVRLLHAAPTTFGRNATSIASPPPFNATVAGSVLVAADAQILLAATPSSTVDIAGVLTLRGGCLSGSGRLRVRGETLVLSHPINASDEGKDTTRPTETSAAEFPSSLRDGLILDVSGGGRWIGGQVHVLDGVSVVNRGRFKITVEGASFGKHSSLKGRPRLHFDGIGWYPNPICREKCMAESVWRNVAGGELIVDGAGNARLCFVLQNEGTVRVEDGSLLDVCGDGEGAASGTLHLPGTNSTLRISAGKLHLEAGANVTGKGVLEFSGGQGHELAEAMLPLVKVSGDARVTFSGSSLFLGQGLTVMDRATIDFPAVASRIHIEGDLSVCGDGMLTFPDPSVEDSSLRPDFGVSSPPWGDVEGDLDGGNGWGAPSRSSIWVEGNFLWAGGTFDGNARAVSAGESTWLCELRTLCSVSTKRLVNSFHLVNHGDTQWYHGDVLVLAGAAFINRGTLRLPNSPSSKPDGLCHHGFEDPRIRAPRQGDRSESRTRTSTALKPFNSPSDTAVAGGAGSDAGAAANWAWEGSNYQGT